MQDSPDRTQLPLNSIDFHLLITFVTSSTFELISRQRKIQPIRPSLIQTDYKSPGREAGDEAERE